MKRPKLTIDDMKAFEEKLLYDIKFAYVRTGHASVSSPCSTPAAR